MHLLVAVSIVWAFSFGIYKQWLTVLDPSFVAFARLALGMPFLLPFLKPLPRRSICILMGIGAVQFGLMYAALNASYAYLPAWQVALFTVLTPMYICLLDDLRLKRLRPINHLVAVLAVVGAGWIAWRVPAGAPGWAGLTGFAILQVANLSFAFGQIAWRETRPGLAGVGTLQAFSWVLLGAVVFSGVINALFGQWINPLELPGPTLRALLYMGVIATGLGFLAWNTGATLVSTARLAAINNLKVPLAVIVSLVVFRESASLLSLAIGSSLILAAILLSRGSTPARAS